MSSPRKPAAPGLFAAPPSDRPLAERLRPAVLAEVVGQGDGLGQVFVESQSPRDIATDRRHFHGVGQSGAQVIPRTVQKDLGLAFQTTEGPAVDHPIPIALEFGAPGGRVLGMDASAALRAFLRVRGQELEFSCLKL